jgi:hypothetical protein
MKRNTESRDTRPEGATCDAVTIGTPPKKSCSR